MKTDPVWSGGGFDQQIPELRTRDLQTNQSINSIQLLKEMMKEIDEHIPEMKGAESAKTKAVQAIKRNKILNKEDDAI